MRQQVENLFTAPADNASMEENTPHEEENAEKKTKPAWQIAPSLGVAGAWTNAAPGRSSGNDSWISVLEPTLLVNADTDRIRGTINLAPKLQYYTNAYKQNGFDNDFDANTSLTLWPEHVFIQLQGYGAVQSTLGGVGPSGTTILDRRTADQTYSFAATPYISERFSDLLTGEIGTSFGYTSKNPLVNSTLTGPSTDISHQYMNSLREYMGFTLGPALGRTSASLTASATQMNGTGVSRDAHRNNILLDLGYGITHGFTLLATTGYEDIVYHTVPRYHVNEGVWRAGFRWNPEPESSITATYGRQYGINALHLDASYAPTGHIHLYARYNEAVTSELQDLQDAVTSSILDPFGSPVDPVTRAPLLLNSNFFSSQLNNVLTRTSNGSVSAALLFDRDTILLTATYRRQKPIGYAPELAQGATFVTEKDLLGSISWQHDVSPNTTLNTFLEYGTSTGRTIGIAGSIKLFVASGAVSYALNETTRLRVQYSYSTEPTGIFKVNTNIFTVGIRRDL